MNHRKLRALAYIRRFNFERCNRYESVAEHAHFVSLLATDAARALGWGWAEVSLATTAALVHDAEEAVTGDIPFLVKRSMPSVAVAALESRAIAELGVACSAPDDVMSLVELCDAVELAMYLQEEVASGNVGMRRMLAETYGRIMSSRLAGPLTKWLDAVLEVVIVAGMTEELPVDLKH